MGKFISAAVPSGRTADGRDFITAETARDDPAVAEFIGRFSNYWTLDPERMLWLSPRLDVVA
jgi:hypothetical protein